MYPVVCILYRVCCCNWCSAGDESVSIIGTSFEGSVGLFKWSFCLVLDIENRRLAVNEPPCSSAKGSPPNQKVSTNLKSRRGWRKQENQQYKARQDRLNNSRKHRNDDLCASNEEVHVRKSKANLSAEVPRFNSYLLGI